MTSMFFKATSRDKDPTSPTKSIFGLKPLDDDEPITTAGDDGSSPGAVEQSKTRKRKGSLRKTALLGGKRIVAAGRERKGSFSLLSRPSSIKNAQQQAVHEQDHEPTSAVTATENADTTTVGRDERDVSPSPPDLHNHRDFVYANPAAMSSSESSIAEPPAATAARLSLLTDPKHLAPPPSATRKTVNELGSPVDVKSPASQKSYTSTTDDDDLLTIPRPAKSYPSQSSGSIVNAPSSSTASSYLLVEPPLLHHRRSSKRSSPLSRSIPAYPSVDAEPHDYTETEYWGWLILFVTWLTFTVGMGSCLGIWSWAWDVGERPVAPEELSDDESLPIVGYYPALMVLTGIVAWIWITVAWVGMKYFRHAKIEV